MLHLDIKPENVLIDKQGHVKVTDLAWHAWLERLVMALRQGGTMGQMPPEQMEQRNLSERCDEWALASLAYEMISAPIRFWPTAFLKPKMQSTMLNWLFPPCAWKGSTPQ